ncbi:MAG: peptidoglycan D,D-transpeptidase FtsI family protein [Phycisphaerae bacterium]
MRSGLLLFTLAGLMLVGGGARLVYIERTEGEALRQTQLRQSTATLVIPAQRGDILDSRGRVLAGSTRLPSVYVDPSCVDDPRFACYSVAPVLGLDAAQLERDLRRAQTPTDEQPGGSRFLWIKREITNGELDAFNLVRQTRQLGAFGVQYEPKRVYPCGRLAAQVLGFVRAEYKGLAGIEHAFEEQLRGTPGQRRYTVDVRRRKLRQHAEDYTPPRDGASVVLTIDAYIQQRAEHWLRDAVTTHKAAWGACVVMDPQTGEVLAMASVPDFDPADPFPGARGELRDADLERTRNRAIADQFEPGSIFKPFVASLALEEGLTRIGENFAINGPTRVFGGRTIHDTHPYGALLFEEIISKSSNIGMALLGTRCGNPRLHRYVRSFGFGDPTGITLPGEASGKVRDIAVWGPFSTQSVPFGQELSVTSIQVATAFSVFSNGGVLYRPRIVRGLIGPDGIALFDDSAPVPVRRVLAEQTAREFRLKALAQTVISGTGKNAALKDHQVFGKTGTAEIADPRLGYLPGQYVGSFVGGAPSDHPRVVAVVSIYRPSAGKYYGGTVAAPAAREIIADVLAYMHVPPQRDMPLPPSLSARAAADRD